MLIPFKTHVLRFMKTPGRKVTKIQEVLTIVTIFIVFLLCVLRLVYGPGEPNPVFRYTGQFIGDWIYRFLYLLLFLLISNAKFIAYTKRISDHFTFTSKENTEHYFFSRRYFLNLFLFTLSTYFFLLKKEENLFIGVDGDYSQVIAKNQKIWGDESINLGMNFLQGIGGNLWFPINSRVDLGYFIWTQISNSQLLVPYLIWAVFLNMSTAYLCFSLGFKREIVTLASWISPFFIILPSVFQVSTVPQLIPHMSSSIAVNTIILGICLKSVRISPSLMNSAFPIIFLFFYFVIINPTFILLAAPMNFLILAALTYGHLRKKSFKRYFCFVLLPLAVSAMYFLPYLRNIVDASAASEFQDEYLTGEKNLRSISILFRSPLASLTFTVSTLSLAYLINKTMQIQHKYVYVSLASFLVVLIALGTPYVLNPEIWKGPAPNYFEFMMWPIYAILFSIPCYWTIASAITWVISKLDNPRINELNAIIIGVLTIAVLVFSQMNIPSQRSWRFPAQSNEILEKLGEISTVPGDPFKGRVMTFTGMNLPSGIDWSDLQDWDYLVSIPEFGTDFRKADLWLRNIPTLTEYSQTLSPISYQLLITLLGREGDNQTRNILTLRKIDLKALELLGVKMIVTDEPQEDLQIVASVEGATTSYFLYKLRNANLSGFSPTNARLGVNPKEALEIMKSKSFNPRKEVLIAKSNLDTNLKTIYSSNIRVLKNGYEVNAKSRGKSILVLPIEYSSCFVAKENNVAESSFEVLPVNFGLMGIMFDQEVNLTLDYQFGLGKNMNCRLRDMELLST